MGRCPNMKHYRFEFSSSLQADMEFRRQIFRLPKETFDGSTRVLIPMKFWLFCMFFLCLISLRIYPLLDPFPMEILSTNIYHLVDLLFFHL